MFVVGIKFGDDLVEYFLFLFVVLVLFWWVFEVFYVGVFKVLGVKVVFVLVY